MATKQKRPDMVQSLLQNGADPHLAGPWVSSQHATGHP